MDPYFCNKTKLVDQVAGTSGGCKDVMAQCHQWLQGLKATELCRNCLRKETHGNRE